MEYIKEKANFSQQRYDVRDGVVLYAFVRHEGFDKNDVALPDDGQAFPEA